MCYAGRVWCFANLSRDVEQYKKDETGLQPLRKYTGHSAYVGDVDWHPEYDYMFGSVGDDRKLMLWVVLDGGGTRTR